MAPGGADKKRRGAASRLLPVVVSPAAMSMKSALRAAFPPTRHSERSEESRYTVHLRQMVLNTGRQKKGAAKKVRRTAATFHFLAFHSAKLATYGGHPLARFVGLPPKGETTHYILRVADAPSKCVRCASTGKRLTWFSGRCRSPTARLSPTHDNLRVALLLQIMFAGVTRVPLPPQLHWWDYGCWAWCHNFTNSTE